MTLTSQPLGSDCLWVVESELCSSPTPLCTPPSCLQCVRTFVCVCV